jgi:hypothetical protein
VWLLGGFEFGDWIVREPAAADGVAADLAERNQRDDRSGRGEGAFVRGRPRGDPIDAQIAQPDGAKRFGVRVGRLLDVPANVPLVAFAGGGCPATFLPDAAFEPEPGDLADGEAPCARRVRRGACGRGAQPARSWRQPSKRSSPSAIPVGRWARPGPRRSAGDARSRFGREGAAPSVLLRDRASALPLSGHRRCRLPLGRRGACRLVAGECCLFPDASPLRGAAGYIKG